MEWSRDRLLPGYECVHITLPGVVAEAGETASAFTAALIRCHAPRRQRAVLYLHGWADYFFHTHVADFFESHGFDFYALELRRYGRNLEPGMFAGYIGDLDDCALELDLAMAELRESHHSVIVLAHSTGGLVSALWADRRPGEIDGLILNSPWLSQYGSPILQGLSRSVIRTLGLTTPTRALTLPDTGFNRRILWIGAEGEWDYDPALKHDPFAVRPGWLRAILAGQARVARGLSIEPPILTLVSDLSNVRLRWDEAMRRADIVLDVRAIAAASVRLGECVTVQRVAGGVHDLALSQPDARARYFAAIEHWLHAYLD